MKTVFYVVTVQSFQYSPSVQQKIYKQMQDLQT